MQRRLVRKRDLEILLSKIKPCQSPKAYLEQYTIPPKAAAELLCIAAHTHDDIEDQSVIDLGCGTGRLAIGSVFLGAKEATGVDVDKAPLRRAVECATELGVNDRTQWVASDIATIRGDFDTVLQNPPFGIQRRRADRKFLRKSLQIGRRVYSLHRRSQSLDQADNRHLAEPILSSPSRFLKKFIEECGGHIDAVYTLLMIIPHMFPFHEKKEYRFLVDLYVIERK